MKRDANLARCTAVTVVHPQMRRVPDGEAAGVGALAALIVEIGDRERRRLHRLCRVVAGLVHRKLPAVIQVPLEHTMFWLLQTYPGDPDNVAFASLTNGDRAIFEAASAA